VAFTGQFPSKCPLIYLFKVNLNKSEYILEILDNSKMKNCKMIQLRDTIAVYHITIQKDADILTVTVAVYPITIQKDADILTVTVGTALYI
jgi:hypothetical protein